MPELTPGPIAHYEPRTVPYAHQRRVLEHCWDRPHWGLLLEMGTGKSKIIIDNICMLREAGGLDRALVLAPKGVIRNWPKKEIPAHMPERHAEGAHVHLWRGGGSATEKRELDFFMRRSDRLKILCMNTEAISQSSTAYHIARRFVEEGRCMVAVDESSTIKNPDAKRAEKIRDLRDISEWRRIATGTPSPRSPLDLWSQFEFLRRACLGHSSYYAFRARYAILEEVWYPSQEKPVKLVVGHRDTDMLSAKLAEHASILRKEDCIDLPPKVYEEFEVELTPEQQRNYEELRKYATTELLTGKFVTATVVIAKLLRLHQIVCGHTKDEEGVETDIPTRRPDALESVINESSLPVIVWATYRRDIDKIMKKLDKMGLRAVRYDGSTSQDDRDDAIFRFQGRRAMVDKSGREIGEEVCPAERRADVFVGTQSAGGYGITLTEARTVVYYSNNYDLEKRLQSEDRAHRIGQTRSVTYIDLVARGTIDEKIMEVLRRKQILADIIMDGPARIREFLQPVADQRLS